MSGPLQGLRVVELASIGPGPHVTMIPGDLGTEVVRVERRQAAAPNTSSAVGIWSAGSSRRVESQGLENACGRAKLVPRGGDLRGPIFIGKLLLPEPIWRSGCTVVQLLVGNQYSRFG